eukprot:1675042-Prorocentrum_lima.AAC.1
MAVVPRQILEQFFGAQTASGAILAAGAMGDNQKTITAYTSAAARGLVQGMACHTPVDIGELQV